MVPSFLCKADFFCHWPGVADGATGNREEQGEGLLQRGWLKSDPVPQEDGAAKKRLRLTEAEVTHHSSVACSNDGGQSHGNHVGSGGSARLAADLGAAALLPGDQQRAEAFGVDLGASMEEAPPGYSIWAPRRGTGAHALLAHARGGQPPFVKQVNSQKVVYYRV